MRYEDIRHSVQTFDLISFEGGRFFSWLIRIWRGTSISHVAIAWKRTDGRVMIIESMERVGVRSRALSEVGPFKWCPVESTDEQRRDAHAEFGLIEGRVAYNSVGIIGQIARRLYGRIPKRYQSDDKVYCSEFGAWVFWKFLGASTPISPAPDELERFAEAHLLDRLRGTGSVRVQNNEPRKISFKRT